MWLGKWCLWQLMWPLMTVNLWVTQKNCLQWAVERHIFGKRLLDLALGWPLTQIKLWQFPASPLLSSLSLSSLPTARHFCFHMADFSGNTLIFVAFGVGSRVCCAYKVFFTQTYPSIQIELFSHFLPSPLNHLPVPELPIIQISLLSPPG